MGNLVFSVNPTGSGLDFTVDRTNLQCAPDSVRCTVDLSNVIFSTSAPSASDLIDLRYRNLEIRWNFGDSGNWTAPTKLLSAHAAKSIGYGAFATHVYSAAGTYDITCEVREWSTGYYATKTKSVTVVSADSVYPTTQTIAINNVGDTDFSWKPTGATEVNADSITEASALFTDEFGSTAKRFLFKPSGTFDVAINVNNSSAPPNIFFGSGAGGKATINPIVSDGVALSFGSSYGAVTLSDVRIDNLNFVGTYDPATTNIGEVVGDQADRAISTVSPLDLIIHACDVSFMREGMCTIQESAAGNQALIGHWVIADCNVTDCGGQYWIYSRRNDEKEGPSGAIIGSRVYPQSDQIDGGGQRFTAFREDGHLLFHMRSNELAAMDNGNTTCKLLDAPSGDLGAIYTVHSNRFEGCLYTVAIQGQWTGNIGRSVAANLLFEKNVLVGGYSNEHLLLCNAGGLTARDNLFILPGGEHLFDQSAEAAGGHTYGNRQMKSLVTMNLQGTVPTATQAVSNEVYNCTLVMARTATENLITVGEGGSGTGMAEGFESSAGQWPNITTANNIISGAALNDDNSLGPLTSTALAAPHSLGFVGASSKTLDTGFAPDPADVADYKPDTGAGALATAAGLISYSDIVGTIRPAGSEDQGCWQVSGV